MISILGKSVVESVYMLDRIKEKRHRQKRINKKLVKKFGKKIKEVPSKSCYMFEGKIICHPKLYKKIEEALERRECLNELLKGR